MPPKDPHVRGRQRRYCSTRCRSAAQWARERGRSAPFPKRECLACGKSFQPRQENHRCCSPACGKRHENQQRYGRAGNSNYYRTAFLEERGGVCERCGVPDGLEIHHRVAVTAGGSNRASNLVVLCGGCHLGEHGRSPKPEPESYVSPFVGPGAKASNLRDVI